MMETLPVTLIVKAPNQQIEDQTVQCELTWTINKLKQHLSEVYPSKPPKHEQKLIYSGQLLTDSLVLKDILRQYEGQETHTVHLVCTPKHTAYQSATAAAAASGAPKNSNTTSNSNTVSQASAAAAATATAQPTPPSYRPQNASASSATDRPLPNMPMFNGGVAFDPAQYTTQVAMMQQAYIHYMSQYMQLAYANAFQMPAVPSAVPQAQTAQPPAAQQPAHPPPAQPVPAPARDPDNPERDWLDVFYMLTRALVLFSFVYFYSSPARFIFVLMLGIGIYLYQIGFFRNIQQQQQQQQRQQQQQQQQRPQQQQQQQQPQRQHNNNNNNNNNNDHPGARQEDEDEPSRLMLVWTFFATFFASLIPEIPNAV